MEFSVLLLWSSSWGLFSLSIIPGAGSAPLVLAYVIHCFESQCCPVLYTPYLMSMESLYNSHPSCLSLPHRGLPKAYYPMRQCAKSIDCGSVHSTPQLRHARSTGERALSMTVIATSSHFTCGWLSLLLRYFLLGEE
jgi:hypothetical protein